MEGTKRSSVLIDKSLPNVTPPPWYAFYIPSQGWAACWKGPKTSQGVGPDGDLYPVCHMRWTDGMRPEIEERLENEIRFIVRAVNSFDSLLAAAKAEIDRCPNCFDRNCTDGVHDQINAAIAAAEEGKTSEISAG